MKADWKVPMIYKCEVKFNREPQCKGFSFKLSPMYGFFRPDTMTRSLASCFRPLPGGGSSSDRTNAGCSNGLHPSDLVCTVLLPLCLCPPGFITHPSAGLSLLRQEHCVSSSPIFIIYFSQCWGSVRIRIPGSVPLANGSGSNSGSDSFLQWLKVRYAKKNFCHIFFLLTYLQAHFSLKNLIFC